MDYSFDFVGRGDLPGELWETVDLVECAICEADCNSVCGLCQHCFDRLPRIGDCRLTLAAMISRYLPHLVACSDCRDYLDALAELGRIVDMEREEVTAAKPR